MTKNFFAILIFTFAGFSALAQEVLTMPGTNPAVADKFRLSSKAALATPSVTLPFYDDFSVISVYPSPLRWADEFAFVNTDYAKFPPSIGVATLDALDESGALYPNAGNNPFDADYLTSLPIRLDSVFSPAKEAITLADPVYFSFYFQPQGRTISPPSKVSWLILEFHSPGDNDTIITTTGTTIEPRWRERWATTGGTPVDTFAVLHDGMYFSRVTIPLNKTEDSTLYYKNGFQFRFRNIAALVGNSQSDWLNNGSHWNIDVVWLNVGLPVQKDITFGDQAPSMLLNYESMPFRQYLPNFVNEMKDTLDIAIANLDNVNQNVTYRYDVYKSSFTPIASYNPGGYIIKPFLTDGYCDYKPFAKPPVNFFFPTSTDQKLVFHITHTLTPDPNPLFRSNDSIQFDQLFSNYYAYDNGTAEAGIGINGAGSYAVQFKLNVADTLRGIQFYFNQVVGGANQKLIDLEVRNDALGKPGQIIKSLNSVTPIYTDNLNEFSSYWFEEPVIVNTADFPGLIFYIGWSQSFVDNLNVGFDRYKDSHLKRYYNVNGNWEMSNEINYGSLMMRPIVGPANPLGIVKPIEVQQLSIRPNPVTDGNLFIQLPESLKNTSADNLQFTIISATGSQALSGSFSNPVDVSSVAPGFYLVILTDENNGQKFTGKLIIR